MCGSRDKDLKKNSPFHLHIWPPCSFQRVVINVIFLTDDVRGRTKPTALGTSNPHDSCDLKTNEGASSSSLRTTVALYLVH